MDAAAVAEAVNLGRRTWAAQMAESQGVQCVLLPRCPTCGTDDVKRYATKGRTRYFRCGGCCDLQARRPSTFKALYL